MTYLKYDPFAVGFDRMIDRINAMQSTAKSATNYPPYNVIKTSENEYLVEIAVAGFHEDDFDVSLKDGVLSVKADASLSEDDITFIHKGIANRGFERTFTLADTIEVRNVELDRGMLTISLENVIPEEKRPIKFEVTKKQQLLTE